MDITRRIPKATDLFSAKVFWRHWPTLKRIVSSASLDADSKKRFRLFALGRDKNEDEKEKLVNSRLARLAILPNQARPTRLEIVSLTAAGWFGVHRTSSKTDFEQVFLSIRDRDKAIKALRVLSNLEPRLGNTVILCALSEPTLNKRNRMQELIDAALCWYSENLISAFTTADRDIFASKEPFAYRRWLYERPFTRAERRLLERVRQLPFWRDALEDIVPVGKRNQLNHRMFLVSDLLTKLFRQRTGQPQYALTTDVLSALLDRRFSESNVRKCLSNHGNRFRSFAAKSAKKIKR